MYYYTLYIYIIYYYKYVLCGTHIIRKKNFDDFSNQNPSILRSR